MARNVVGRCNLCFKHRPLIKGHILPKWCGKLGQNKRMIEMVPYLVRSDGRIKSVNEDRYVSSDEPHNPEYARGLASDYILCGPCDEELGKGENTLREIIHPTGSLKYIKQLNVNGAKIKFIVEDPIAETLFLKACLGLLFKVHCTQNSQYQGFKLPDNHLRIIRDALERTKINQNRFSISIFKLYNFTQSIFCEEIIAEELVPPYGLAGIAFANGGYIIIAGGFLMILQIKKQNGRVAMPPMTLGLPYPIAPLDIKHIISDERLLDFSGIIVAGSDEGTGELFNLVMSDEKLQRKNCPCFVFYSSYDTNKAIISERKTFADCCMPYWF